ncbi:MULTISPECIES: glycosyltransferase [unclassified Cupriavidus]|uniref:glycosyltransferase n=1 Tax=unclassified Cupriavidus TaxID=2640874 RepID=UPI00313E2B2F
MPTIVHVTEALGGGVLHCIELLANEQIRAGHRVIVVHSIREETPSVSVLDTGFHRDVQRIVLDMRTEPGWSDLGAVLKLAVLLRRHGADAVHLHSSKAGALGRVAALLSGLIGRTCYSPHGFAFLRRDISARKRGMFLRIEQALGLLGARVTACSASEARYARLAVRSRRTCLLENAIDLDTAARPGGREGGGRVRVVTSGRVTYAKAPWRFGLMARALADPDATCFDWLGDGDDDVRRRWLAGTPVRITGWLERDALLRELATSDIFVMTSLWEGMPIALIEAQAMGIPAVVSRVSGNRDIVRHGVTGFVAGSDEELIAYTWQLVRDASLRARMGEAARRAAHARFGKEAFARRSLDIYFGEKTTMPSLHPKPRPELP